MLKKRLHAIYSGKVQGVGFRFYVRSIAYDLGLLGWVKNLSDGKVEIVLEGFEDKIKEFLEEIIKQFPEQYIENVDLKWQDSKEEFESFIIRIK